MLLYRYTSKYSPYKYLLTSEADRHMEKFISRERPLREYVKEIEKLNKMADEIGSFPVFVPMHLFLLDCSHINEVKDMEYTYVYVYTRLCMT